MHPVFVTILFLVILFALAWLGLQVKPKSFHLPALPKNALETFPIPAGLPAPVERFYKEVYGVQLPLVESAVMAGKGRIRPFGIWLPARFVFVHNAGKDYRH